MWLIPWVRFRSLCIGLNLLHCAPLEETIPHLYLYSSSFYIQWKRDHPSHLHYSRMRIWHCFPVFWVIICPHFWTLYSFHFPLFFSHSKSFIYANTCIINQQILNKTKPAQFWSLPVDTNPQKIINKSNKTHRKIRKKKNQTKPQKIINKSNETHRGTNKPRQSNQYFVIQIYNWWKRQNPWHADRSLGFFPNFNKI